MATIGFRDTDKEVKTLILDGEEYKFTELFLCKEKPWWKVMLENGGVLLVNFTDIGEE